MKQHHNEETKGHLPVRNKRFSLINVITRTVFVCIYKPRATPGFTGIALGYIILAFQAAFLLVKYPFLV